MINRILVLLPLLFISFISSACEDLDKSLYDSLQDSQVVSFGEIHGTQEMPAFFGEIVCLFSQQGKAISVGLEIDSSAQGDLDEFFNTVDVEVAKSVLIDNPHWAEITDGRSSEAMWNLMIRLHQVSLESETDVYVYAFSSNHRERRIEDMVDSIKEVIETGRYQHNLFLSGNLHSQTDLGSPFDQEFESVAYRLKQEAFDIASVLFIHSGGTAWLCTDECGKTELTVPYPESPMKVLRPVRYQIFKHDYELNIGAISSSPPVTQ